MFAKAGKGPTKKKEQSSMSEALTQAALAISTAFSPRAPLPSSSSIQPLGTSPAKEIESRSKCYKQLNELNQLRSSGIITEDEYFEEKESVMCVLRKLKGNRYRDKLMEATQCTNTYNIALLCMLVNVSTVAYVSNTVFRCHHAKCHC